MEAIALRLKPQQDLKGELDDFVSKQQIEAACILTCVGSLSAANLRFASQPEGTVLSGKFEIVSLTGVMSMHGSHYHISIANSTGRTVGGHLLKGCSIYTTAEIIVGILPQYRFRREYDSASGFRELAIEPIASPNPQNPLS
ncbi:MAG: DNA-binding protein [Leptolyngbyaceae cyanobacterium SM1_3_5]|nr:DNA-binding protein [Leptolyngbyaceae cyanobacterium SM1_3_5]